MLRYRKLSKIAMDNYDAQVIDRVKFNIAKVQAHKFSEVSLVGLSTVYGVLSVAYYTKAISLVGDTCYDYLCDYLYQHYDEALQQGASPVVLSKESLAAGTGMHLERVHDLTGYASYIHYITNLIVADT